MSACKHRGLHRAHGQTGNPAASSVSSGAVPLLHKRDHVTEQHRFEQKMIHHMAFRRGRVLSLDHPVIHDNHKWDSLSLCKQVIENQICSACRRPSDLVLSVSVLQIQYRILHFRMRFIARRRINHAPFPLAGHGREENFAPDHAVRHILQGAERSTGTLEVKIIIRPAVSIADWKIWTQLLLPVHQDLHIINSFLKGKFRLEELLFHLLQSDGLILNGDFYLLRIFLCQAKIEFSIPPGQYLRLISRRQDRIKCQWCH